MLENRLITQYLTALRRGDHLGQARLQAIAAEYDTHNGSSLVEQLEALSLNGQEAA
jgi:hypothetical protein